MLRAFPFVAWDGATPSAGRTMSFCKFATVRLDRNVVVESAPTHTSNVEGSSTHAFFAVLQYVSSSFPIEK